VGVVIALVLSAAFGAGDQYLGSGHVFGIGWATDVSLLSAPWILLAFVAGATQKEPRRAVLLGLGCTFAAILGYFLLTDSPLENAHYTLAGARGFVASDPRLFVGGLLAGPVFGWFGQQWRNGKDLLGALLVAAALCLEPLAHRFSVDPIRYQSVTIAEVAAGILFAAAVLTRRYWQRA
jgi:Family of unknown function (DUF6518)